MFVESFIHYNCFTPTWFRPSLCLAGGGLDEAAAFWAGATWGTVSSSCGYPPSRLSTTTGRPLCTKATRFTYNGDPIATAEEYAEQATQFATQGKEAKADDKDEWISLGVFGMVQGEEKDANNIFQLAINKDGIIRGNYYNALSDTTRSRLRFRGQEYATGRLDGGRTKGPVYETGIGNLTQPQTTMLVHFGKDRTQQWTLVRLEARRTEVKPWKGHAPHPHPLSPEGRGVNGYVGPKTNSISKGCRSKKEDPVLKSLKLQAAILVAACCAPGICGGVRSLATELAQLKRQVPAMFRP